MFIIINKPISVVTQHTLTFITFIGLFLTFNIELEEVHTMVIIYGLNLNVND